MSSLRELFEDVLLNYSKELEEARRTGNFKRKFGEVVRNAIPNKLREYITNDNYKIKGSVGVGLWTNIPWIAILDQRITSTAKEGIYIAYLFNKDTKTLYLTLNQGATNVLQEGTTQGTTKAERLELNAKKIRETLPGIKKYSAEIKTGSIEYDAGNIAGVKYGVDSLPDDEQLSADFRSFMHFYELYFDYFVKKEKKEDDPKQNEDESEVLTTNIISSIRGFIESKGFSYGNGMIENFYLSLKTKPFVILAGTSGTGKTKLVRLFAEAIGAGYKLVSVRPDWSDSSDLFGHVDLNGRFNEGVILSFVKEAELNEDKPYILCLDEMNLARVEYYLSNILSVIETREKKDDGRITTDSLIPIEIFGKDEESRKKFGLVQIPDNLYIVGTVNMDETTFPFSKKVLDRANTIEFSYVDLVPVFVEDDKNDEAQTLTNDFLKTRYLVLKRDCKKDVDYVMGLCEHLQKINEILKEADAQVGYRTRDEIVFYMLNNRNDKLLPEYEAFDNEIMQKILPRVQGGSSAIKNMLVKLFTHLSGDYSGYAEGKSLYEQMKAFFDNKGSNYPKSSEKIMYMIRRYEEDGFTSFWL